METAFKDGLTGLFTREYLAVRVHEEAARYTRFGEPVSLALIEIDDFRAIHDRFGSSGGDAVLQATAQLLRLHTRACTILARYGEDTFAALLVNTPRAGALSYAQRIQGVITQYAFPQGRLTASMGVASLSEDATSVDDFIGKAHGALRDAKRLGGDRVAGPAHVSVAEPQTAVSRRLEVRGPDIAGGPEAMTRVATAPATSAVQTVTATIPSPEIQTSLASWTHRCPACRSQSVARSTPRGFGEWLILWVSRCRPYRCLTCRLRFYDRPHTASRRDPRPHGGR